MLASRDNACQPLGIAPSLFSPAPSSKWWLGGVTRSDSPPPPRNSIMICLCDFMVSVSQIDLIVPSMVLTFSTKVPSPELYKFSTLFNSVLIYIRIDSRRPQAEGSLAKKTAMQLPTVATGLVLCLSANPLEALAYSTTGHITDAVRPSSCFPTETMAG